MYHFFSFSFCCSNLLDPTQPCVGMIEQVLHVSYCSATHLFDLTQPCVGVIDEAFWIDPGPTPPLLVFDETPMYGHFVHAWIDIFEDPAKVAVTNIAIKSARGLFLLCAPYRTKLRVSISSCCNAYQQNRTPKAKGVRDSRNPFNLGGRFINANAGPVDHKYNFSHASFAIFILATDAPT